MKIRWQSAVSALALAPLLAAAGAAGAQGKNLVGDETIVASLNPPPADMSCADAAAQTSVFFNFAHPTFQVSQISLYVDGRGVQDSAIDEHWPTVTLKSGLHPGLNTIDVVANGASGQTMDRRLQVQIGDGQSTDTSVVGVACNDAPAVAQAAPGVPVPVGAEVPPSIVGGDTGEDVVEAPPPAVVEAPPPTVVEEQPAYVAEAPPVYYDYPAPVYVYNPYPVVALDPWVPFIPFFSFGFFYSNFHPYCPPPTFAYHDHWNGGWGGGGWHGGGWHDGGHDWHGNGFAGGGDSGGGRGGNWNGGWRGSHDPGQQTAQAGSSRGFAPAPGGGRFGGGNGGGPAQHGGWGGMASQHFAPHPGYAQAGARAMPASHPGYAQPGYAQSAARGAPSYRGSAGGSNFTSYHAPQYRAAPSASRSYAPPAHGGGWGGGVAAGGGWHGQAAYAAPSFHGGGGFGGGVAAGGGFHGGGGGGGGGGFHGGGGFSGGGFHGGGGGAPHGGGGGGHSGGGGWHGR